jgi:hypothetical protein
MDDEEPLEEKKDVSPAVSDTPWADYTATDPVTAADFDPFVGFYQDNATFIEGNWAGHVNYECSACGFASIDLGKAEAHLTSHGKTFTQGERP